MQSSRNSGKHFVHAKVTPSNMKELGENPADFESLRRALFEAFEPRDGFEKSLVEDMAEIRWRRARLMRAESGILASEKRKFELDREWHVASKGRGAQFEYANLLAAQYGLSGNISSELNLSDAVDFLQDLRDEILAHGFREEGLQILDVVYGKKPTLARRSLKISFECCQQEQETQNPDLQKENREMFVKEIDDEIASIEKLLQLHRAKHLELSGPQRDAKLVLPHEELEKISRYEAHLERQFERKLQQFVAWRRAKGDSDFSGDYITRDDAERKLE